MGHGVMMNDGSHAGERDAHCSENRIPWSCYVPG